MQQGPPHTNPGQAAKPSISVEQFREKFKEYHRSALRASIDVQYKAEYYHQIELEERTPGDAHRIAMTETAEAREALQLLNEVHPVRFGW